jgi:type IV pilus biogenesis protein CpaD/CtpE
MFRTLPILLLFAACAAGQSTVGTIYVQSVNIEPVTISSAVRKQIDMLIMGGQSNMVGTQPTNSPERSGLGFQTTYWLV